MEPLSHMGPWHFLGSIKFSYFFLSVNGTMCWGTILQGLAGNLRVKFGLKESLKFVLTHTAQPHMQPWHFPTVFFLINRGKRQEKVRVKLKLKNKLLIDYKCTHLCKISWISATKLPTSFLVEEGHKYKGLTGRIQEMYRLGNLQLELKHAAYSGNTSGSFQECVNWASEEFKK